MLDVPFEEMGWDPENVELCHGIVEGTGGERWGHAWLECETPKQPIQVCDVELAVHDFEILISSRTAYYNSAKIRKTEVVRYKRMDAIHTALDAGHYGPWE